MLDDVGVGTAVDGVGVARDADGQGDGDGVQLDVVTDGRPPDDGLAEREHAFVARFGEHQHRDEATTFTAVGVAECDLHAALDPGDGELVEHAVVDDGIDRTQLDRDVLRDGGRKTFELIVEDLRGVIGPGTPVVVAGSGVGDEGEQLLVEVIAEADGRRGDVARPCRTRDTGKTIGVGLAHVGLAVGEQHHTTQGIFAG